MDLFSIAVVFLLVWWVTLFAVLPQGVRGQAEENNIVQGSEPGAPVQANMKQKLIRTTIIAAVITAIISAVIISGLVDISDWGTIE